MDTILVLVCMLVLIKHFIMANSFFWLLIELPTRGSRLHNYAIHKDIPLLLCFVSAGKLRGCLCYDIWSATVLTVCPARTVLISTK